MSMNPRALRLVAPSLLLAGSVAFGLAAQEKPAVPTEQGKAEVKGVLIDSKKEKPVEGVWLYLRYYQGVVGEAPKQGIQTSALMIRGMVARLTSDAEGKFQFNEVPDGRYVVMTGTINYPGGYLSAGKDKTAGPIIVDIENGQSVDLGRIPVVRK